MKEITKECEVCLKYRKKQIIVVVGFSLATEFNECVAMDLKQKKRQMTRQHVVENILSNGKGIFILKFSSFYTKFHMIV